MTISIDDFKPIFVGRGQWHVIHTLASIANTIDERRMVIWVIKTIVNNLRCASCLEHAIKYLKDNPMDNLERNSIDLFRYTYNFHKSANEYANKTSPSFEEVRVFYYENGERCLITTCGE